MAALNNDRQIGGPEQRNRNELRQRVIRRFTVEIRMEGDHRSRRQQQRVSRWRRRDDGMHRDAAACPCAVFDDHSIAERLLQRRRERARDPIDCAAWSKTNDQRRNIGRGGTGNRCRSKNGCRGCRGRGEKAPSVDDGPSLRARIPESPTSTDWNVTVNVDFRRVRCKRRCCANRSYMPFLASKSSRLHPNESARKFVLRHSLAVPGAAPAQYRWMSSSHACTTSFISAEVWAMPR